MEPILVTGPDVLIEGSALDQLRRVAALPGCVRAVGMPDLHPGPGIPIGAALAFDGLVRPDFVGSDAGCGARLTVVRRARASGDDLVRRLRAEMDGDALPEADPIALLEAVWRSGPRGLAKVPGVPAALAELALAEPEEDDPPSAAFPFDLAAASVTTFPNAPPSIASALGTIGGGNHFAEVTRVSEVEDGASGFKKGDVAVLVHSGSRGLGKRLSERWAGRILESTDVETYRRELAGACRFARANRLVLAWRLLRALGAARPQDSVSSFDVTHNTVTGMFLDGRAVYLHRKGCAPAEAGQRTLVLGTRGTPTWVMEGLGNSELLSSVAHGAGRRLVRSEAAARLRSRYTRESLERTRIGGRVLCDDTALMYEEHPDAYKAIEPVVASLVAAGVARRVAALTPLVTVKL